MTHMITKKALKEVALCECIRVDMSDFYPKIKSLEREVLGWMVCLIVFGIIVIFGDPHRIHIVALAVFSVAIIFRAGVCLTKRARLLRAAHNYLASIARNGQ